MKLVKDKNGVFSLKGEYSYVEPIYKTVTVKGEKYHKTTYKDSISILENEEQDIFNGEKQYSVISISPLDLEYKFIKYKKFYISIYKRTTDYYLSENDYVALFQIAFHNKMMDKRILELHCGKDERYYDGMKHDINHDNTISLRVYSYGFNNYVTIVIKMKDFIFIKDKKNKLMDYNLYKNFFERYLNIDIEKISDYEFAQALMKYKLKIKKNEAFFSK